VRGLTLAIGLACSGALSRAEDWPQWRGPRRDGLSRETGLLKKWPEDGPKRLWTARGLGIGFSSMAVANSMIFTAGDKEGKTFLTALDLDGKLLWQTPNGPAWKGNPAGSRSTPTVDDGRVYYLSAHGNLLCADARTGKPIWSLNILERFQGRNITWGLAESPLIDRPRQEDGEDRLGVSRRGRQARLCLRDRRRAGWLAPLRHHDLPRGNRGRGRDGQTPLAPPPQDRLRLQHPYPHLPRRPHLH